MDKEVEQITYAHIRGVTDNLKLSENNHKSITKAFKYMDANTGALGDITYEENKLMAVKNNSVGLLTALLLTIPIPRFVPLVQR